MKQYEMVELCLPGKEPEGSWVEVDLQAEFYCEKEVAHVRGFYAGDGIYKIRYYPSKAGTYQWRVTGIIQEQGTFICESNDQNHGMIRINGHHFCFEDGNKYLPFGTTVYALIHQNDDLLCETMETLSHSPFNKVRFCIFPKYYDYNREEPELFPFAKQKEHWDIHRPNLKFWDKLEHVVRCLDRMGIVADLILFHPYDKWGFSELSKDDCLVYLDYLMRRLSEYPNIWWCLANEYDLMSHFKPECWKEFASYIHSHDRNQHCLSNHNFVKYWDFSDESTTHCCVQNDCMTDVKMLLRKYYKPVIFDECGYEGDLPESWGNLSAFDMVDRFWTVCVLGGYCTHGETYMNEQQILWWSKGGRLHGESVSRIAFLKDIVYSLPGMLEGVHEALESFLLDFVTTDLETLKERAQTDEMVRAFLDWPLETVNRLGNKVKEICGCVGKEAFIVYFGRQCAKKGKMTLPTDSEYQIELIDVWDMTRKKVEDHAKGEVWVELPGKEGIALLAQRREE